MQFMDAAPLSDIRITRDGYLVADARIARTGVQIYAGAEVGRPALGAVRVLRPEAEVFGARAMASMAHRPITNDHPDAAVDATNWKTHAVGMTGGDVARDGQFVRVPMTVMDAQAVADVRSGKRELSVGYTSDLVWTPGRTDEGEAYDAVQTTIRGNHLAIVKAGRAGAACRLGAPADASPDASPEPLITPTDTGDRRVALKTIMVDGFQVETTDAGEAAINKLKSMLADALSAIETTTATHATAMAAKDAELGARDAALADAATPELEPTQLEALVTERVAVLARAKLIASAFVTDGRSNAEVRRGAVALRLGDAAVHDRPDAYVDALFDNLAVEGKVDPLRAAIIDARPVPPPDARETAHARMVEDLRARWKGAA